MYVWKFPIQLLALDLTIVGLLVVTVTSLELRRRVSSAMGRGALLAVVIAAFTASPFVTDVAVIELNTAKYVTRVNIDPPFVLLLVPCITVLLLVALSQLLFSDQSQSGIEGMRWRSGFYIASLALIVANSINLCAPGWCARFGFPVAYFSWSDAIIIVNGQNPSSGSPTGGACDVVVYLVGAIAMSVAYRRKFDGPKPPPNSP